MNKKTHFYYQILKELSMRNLKRKYSSTFLGALWAGVSPLMLTLAIYFVFIKVWGMNGRGFAIFVLSGIVPWLYFSSVIMESTQTFLQEKVMVSHFDFPKFFYPLTTNISNLFQHVIAWLFVLPLFIVVDIHVIPRIPFLLIPILCMWLFLNGICIISAIINLLFRDFQHFLSTGLMILFWLTPVFYSVDMVPEKFKFILAVNPLTYFLKIYRVVLLGIKLNTGDGIFILGGLCVSNILAFFMYTRLYRLIEKKI